MSKWKGQRKGQVASLDMSGFLFVAAIMFAFFLALFLEISQEWRAQMDLRTRLSYVDAIERSVFAPFGETDLGILKEDGVVSEVALSTLSEKNYTSLKSAFFLPVGAEFSLSIVYLDNYSQIFFFGTPCPSNEHFRARRVLAYRGHLVLATLDVCFSDNSTRV